jgi:hypothetical protein
MLLGKKPRKFTHLQAFDKRKASETSQKRRFTAMARLPEAASPAKIDLAGA